MKIFGMIRMLFSARTTCKILGFVDVNRVKLLVASYVAARFAEKRRRVMTMR